MEKDSSTILDLDNWHDVIMIGSDHEDTLARFGI